MSSQLSRVIVGIADHWLLGTLSLENLRIQDRLNDSQSEFVKFSEVEVYPSARQRCFARLPEIIVPKCKMEFVAVPSRQHEAPDQRLARYASRDVFTAFVVLGRYCVSGELHLPRLSGNALHTLTHQLGRFFPLTEAKIDGRDIQQLGFPLLIANKDFVSGFHIGNAAHAGVHEGGLEYLQTLVVAASGEAHAQH